MMTVSGRLGSIVLNFLCLMVRLLYKEIIPNCSDKAHPGKKYHVLNVELWKFFSESFFCCARYQAQEDRFVVFVFQRI